MASAVVVGQQTPRVHVVPPYVSSAGVEAIEVAEVAGLYLDPWQKLVLTDALGETAAGRWAAYRVAVEVARQNGKGGILEARELAGLFAFGERLIIHSAHEQATSTEHFIRLLALMEGVPEFDRRILKVVRGKGQEAIVLRDGYRIFFKTRTGGGGRGFTGDLVVLDEAMILAAAFMGALVPTMAARSIEGDPQLWFTGSAVDQHNPKMDGVEFARVRADALAAVERLAYFGFSAPFDRPEDVPATALDDPQVWAHGNPAMGIRIAQAYIDDERRALGAREFCVERLGVGDWPDVGEAADEGWKVISEETWTGRLDELSAMVGTPVLAFDVTPDRSGAAIGAAGFREDGSRHVQVLEHGRGTAWVPGRLAELVDEHNSGPVKADLSGPAASLVPRLEAAGVEVEALTAKEHAQACGDLFDEVANGSVWHIGQEELDAAVKGAVKRRLGEAWAWSRNNSAVDISPLVAVTLAHWGLGDERSTFNVSDYRVGVL